MGVWVTSVWVTSVRMAARWAFILPIRAYKLLISPFLPRLCRYTPTCSEYAAEAILRHGVLKGMLMGLWRIMRCNPLGGYGYDPVPPESGSSPARSPGESADPPAGLLEQAPGSHGQVR